MSNFIQGPWRIEYRGLAENPEIWAPLSQTGSIKIATICGLAQFDFANLRLIAAAPEMYEALRELMDATRPAHIELSSVKAVRQMVKLLEAQKKAEAALAKADCKPTQSLAPDQPASRQEP
jgi:hypothetical protein